MEIHAPTHPTLTMKDALVHLCRQTDTRRSCEVERQLRLAMGGLAVMQNIARKLDELYARALTAESSAVE